jgi:hypothetical protein
VVWNCRRASSGTSRFPPTPTVSFPPSPSSAASGRRSATASAASCCPVLEGAAVTHIKLKGADHEFSSLQGVLEDVTDIILNIKA